MSQSHARASDCRVTAASPTPHAGHAGHYAGAALGSSGQQQQPVPAAVATAAHTPPTSTALSHPAPNGAHTFTLKLPPPPQQQHPSSSSSACVEAFGPSGEEGHPHRHKLSRAAAPNPYSRTGTTAPQPVQQQQGPPPSAAGGHGPPGANAPHHAPHHVGPPSQAAGYGQPHGTSGAHDTRPPGTLVWSEAAAAVRIQPPPPAPGAPMAVPASHAGLPTSMVYGSDRLPPLVASLDLNTTSNSNSKHNNGVTVAPLPPPQSPALTPMHLHSLVQLPVQQHHQHHQQQQPQRKERRTASQGGHGEAEGGEGNQQERGREGTAGQHPEQRASKSRRLSLSCGGRSGGGAAAAMGGDGAAGGHECSGLSALTLTTGQVQGQGQGRPLDGQGNPRFKNVTWETARGKYRVAIFVKGKRLHLGYFSDCVAAARAADLAHLTFKEGAVRPKDLNFDPADYTPGTLTRQLVEEHIARAQQPQQHTKQQQQQHQQRHVQQRHHHAQDPHQSQPPQPPPPQLLIGRAQLLARMAPAQPASFGVAMASAPPPLTLLPPPQPPPPPPAQARPLSEPRPHPTLSIRHLEAPTAPQVATADGRLFSTQAPHRLLQPLTSGMLVSTSRAVVEQNQQPHQQHPRQQQLPLQQQQQQQQLHHNQQQQHQQLQHQGRDVNMTDPAAEAEAAAAAVLAASATQPSHPKVLAAAQSTGRDGQGHAAAGRGALVLHLASPLVLTGTAAATTAATAAAAAPVVAHPPSSILPALSKAAFAGPQPTAPQGEATAGAGTHDPTGGAVAAPRSGAGPVGATGASVASPLQTHPQIASSKGTGLKGAGGREMEVEEEDGPHASPASSPAYEQGPASASPSPVKQHQPHPPAQHQAALSGGTPTTTTITMGQGDCLLPAQPFNSLLALSDSILATLACATEGLPMQHYDLVPLDTLHLRGNGHEHEAGLDGAGASHHHLDAAPAHQLHGGEMPTSACTPGAGCGPTPHPTPVAPTPGIAATPTDANAFPEQQQQQQQVPRLHPAGAGGGTTQQHQQQEQAPESGRGAMDLDPVSPHRAGADGAATVPPHLPTPGCAAPPLPPPSGAMPTSAMALDVEALFTADDDNTLVAEAEEAAAVHRHVEPMPALHDQQQQLHPPLHPASSPLKELARSHGLVQAGRTGTAHGAAQPVEASGQQQQPATCEAPEVREAAGAGKEAAGGGLVPLAAPAAPALGSLHSSTSSGQHLVLAPLHGNAAGQDAVPQQEHLPGLRGRSGTSDGTVEPVGKDHGTRRGAGGATVPEGVRDPRQASSASHSEAGRCDTSALRVGGGDDGDGGDGTKLVGGEADGGGFVDANVVGAGWAASNGGAGRVSDGAGGDGPGAAGGAGQPAERRGTRAKGGEEEGDGGGEQKREAALIRVEQFHGVWWHTRERRYRAYSSQVLEGGVRKKVKLGSFATPEEAARMYDGFTLRVRTLQQQQQQQQQQQRGGGASTPSPDSAPLRLNFPHEWYEPLLARSHQPQAPQAAEAPLHPHQLEDTLGHSPATPQEEGGDAAFAGPHPFAAAGHQLMRVSSMATPTYGSPSALPAHLSDTVPPPSHHSPAHGLRPSFSLPAPAQPHPHAAHQHQMDTQRRQARAWAGAVGLGPPGTCNPSQAHALPGSSAAGPWHQQVPFSHLMGMGSPDPQYHPRLCPHLPHPHGPPYPVPVRAGTGMREGQAATMPSGAAPARAPPSMAGLGEGMAGWGPGYDLGGLEGAERFHPGFLAGPGRGRAQPGAPHASAAGGTSPAPHHLQHLQPHLHAAHTSVDPQGYYAHTQHMQQQQLERQHTSAFHAQDSTLPPHHHLQPPVHLPVHHLHPHHHYNTHAPHLPQHHSAPHGLGSSFTQWPHTAMTDDGAAAMIMGPGGPLALTSLVGTRSSMLPGPPSATAHALVPNQRPPHDGMPLPQGHSVPFPPLSPSAFTYGFDDE